MLVSPGNPLHAHRLIQKAKFVKRKKKLNNNQFMRSHGGEEVTSLPLQQGDRQFTGFHPRSFHLELREFNTCFCHLKNDIKCPDSKSCIVECHIIWFRTVSLHLLMYCAISYDCTVSYHTVLYRSASYHVHLIFPIRKLYFAQSS